MIPPLRIAHRGASGSGLAPENTLAACERALREGVDAIEIDVHATLDGHVVVLHDSTLDRTTDRSGEVARMTFAQVREADAGAWFGAELAGERVPSLAEVLELARRRAMVVIEVKADHIAERVLQTIAAAGAVDRVVLQSFSAETVRRLKVLEPRIPAAWLLGRVVPGPTRPRARRLVRQLLELGASAASMWCGTLTAAFVEELRLRALSVWTWTVDEEAALRSAISMGVDGIITNYPDRLNRVLDELQQGGHLLPAAGRRSRWVRHRLWRRPRGGAHSERGGG